MLFSPEKKSLMMLCVKQVIIYSKNIPDFPHSVETAHAFNFRFSPQHIKSISKNSFQMWSFPFDVVGENSLRFSGFSIVLMFTMVIKIS
jgi:hypothetical protein